MVMAYVTLNGKRYKVQVVTSENKEKYLTAGDVEMDRRAREAVKAAIHKAKVCGYSVARYEAFTGRVFVEYANGEKKYVE